MVKGRFSVSVVVAVYNEEVHISRCLETLLAQDPPSPRLRKGKGVWFYEVIVVDDGSTDNTLSIINNQFSIFKEEGRLRVYSLAHEGKGPARARNFGAKKAKGEILVFVDGDMEFQDKQSLSLRDENFVSELVEPIVEGKAKGTFSKEEYVANWDNWIARCWNYNEGLKSSRRVPEDYPDEGADFRAILKSEFDRVGGFDDIGYTDTWSLVEKLGYRPKAVKGAKYWHYNPGSLTEVFGQARWIGGRKFKMGFVGKLVALVRASLPVSLVMGVYKSMRFKEPRFLLFKVVQDLGTVVGILLSFDTI
jgi:glycosyltransferase involved in cell wall biosynthesis